MARTRFLRFGVILFVGAIALLAAFMVPRAIEAGPKHEYKFVRLVDDGAMPVITDALNREVDRGWKLAEMSVVAGEPGTICFVFEK